MVGVVLNNQANPDTIHAYRVGYKKVGIPTNHQTKTQFALLHWLNGTWKPEFIRIDYNVEKILREFESSGLNKKANIWSIAIYKTLQTGINYSYKCIRLVRELAAEKEDDGGGSKLTEDLWLEAARQLGIL